MESICPACGIVYAKWPALSEPTNQSTSKAEEFNQDTLARTRREKSWKNLLLAPADRVDSEVFWGYLLIYIAFLIWGWKIILAGMSSTAIMGSFMHNINLPFHEFGHVLFSPFGRFMTILGGSLFQLIMPLIVTLVFLLKKRDPFAASITFWWFGQSFIDLSPYIADATYRSLPLISGMGEESHDWGNLLTMMNLLESDYTIAKTSFAIGASLMLTSMMWGALVLIQMKRNRE